MKYLANERAARRGELLEDSSPQFYTMDRFGQYHLFPAKTSAWKHRLTFLAIILAIGTILVLMMNGA